MIVRDEAAVIERCLGSVRPLIDTWTICDTGSCDGTPELIKSALAAVPGTLVHRPWRDFGTNRSELMELAHGSADYLLLIDADMTLEFRGPLPELHADAYLLRHLGQLEYLVPRLVRGDRRWRFEGATHEYLATEGSHREEVLPALAILHHGDGGTRAEKFARDVRLLRDALRRDPDDARATFYLAQTLREGGETDGAIPLYRRRIDLGGWDEEVFYAAYQLGVLVGHRDLEAAIPLLLDAYERRPERAEPLYELARLHRVSGRNHAAYLFARRAAEIPYPDDLLFVHRDIYQWGITFERSVAAYWIGEYEEALALGDELLAAGGLPADYLQAAEANRSCCLGALGACPDEPAPALADLLGPLETAQIMLEIDPPWAPFNPSLASEAGGFRGIVRTANYRLRGDGDYEVVDADGIVRTQNYLITLDDALELQSVQELADDSGAAPVSAAPVVGYEDLRLFQLGERWHAVATVRDRNIAAICQMALLELDGARIATVRLLDGPDPTQHEKNWAPLVIGNRLHFVYSWAPTLVQACDPATGELTPVAHDHAAPPAAAAFRGGSPGLRLDGDAGWLFVIHEAYDGDNGRSYTHRLVRLGADLRIAAFSARFKLVGAKVEMCLGLVRWYDQLLFAFGVGDGEAHLLSAAFDDIVGLLGHT